MTSTIIIRCFQEDCNKKLSLVEESLGLCKCKLIFCKKHRFSQEHNCTWDWKAEWENKLNKANPNITKKKIDQI